MEKLLSAANFTGSIYFLIMTDILLLRSSLHFTALHPTTLHLSICVSISLPHLTDTGVDIQLEIHS